jgi:predicted GTPase
VDTVRSNLKRLNANATLSEGVLRLDVPESASLRRKHALVIEDGPTITHGGMASGAGLRAVERFGAIPVDPRHYAVGSLAEAYETYPHIGPVLPALGYSDEQLGELAETIRKVPCDVIVVASPVDLRRLISFERSAVRVGYEFEVVNGPALEQILAPLRSTANKDRP